MYGPALRFVFNGVILTEKDFTFDPRILSKNPAVVDAYG